MIISTVTYGLLTAIIVFFALLIIQAGTLGHVTGAEIKFVALGPIRMVELSKVPAAGGTQATIQFLPGFLAYLVLSTAAATLIGLVRSTTE